MTTEESNIIENLPELVQTNKVRADVTYEYEEGVNDYIIQKGPAVRIFEVRDSGMTYIENTDYELIEDTDGNYLTISWLDGGSSPDDGSLFIIDQEYRSVLSRYVAAHDLTFDDIREDTETVIASRQINNAEGEELERIGAIFGQLGGRSGRNDTDYRAYLKSIVSSFSGRGSRSGLKFAISSAVGTTPDNVEIRENAQDLSYTVIVTGVDTALISTSIDELADLADPSGVELEEAVIVVDGGQIFVVGATSTIQSRVGLGGGALDMDGTGTLATDNSSLTWGTGGWDKSKWQ